MNINQLNDATADAKRGEEIVYGKTGECGGAPSKSLMKFAYGLQEAGLVSLVQRRTSKNKLGKESGTFDYIAQRTSKRY